MDESKQSPFKLIGIIVCVAALSVAIVYTGQRDKHIALKFPEIASTNLVVESKLTSVPAPVATQVKRQPIEAKAVRRLPINRQLIRTVVTTTGRGENADWGVKGVYSFVLTSTVVCDAEILRKSTTPGGELKIEERRHYAIARQDLQLSDLDVALALRDTLPVEDLKPVVSILCSSAGFGEVADVVSDGVMAAVKSCDGMSVRGMLKNLGVDVSKQMEEFANGFVEHFTKALFRVSELEGKTYLITYYQDRQSGAPLRVDFSYEDGSPIQTEDEWMVLRRANAFMDSRIVPSRISSPGDTWQFDAAEFDCLLDPYVDGSYHGTVTVRRADDTADGDWRLDAMPTTVTIVTDRGKGIGELNLADGQALIDGQTGIITALAITGKGMMTNLNRHHLLFRTRMEGACDFRAVLTTEPLK